MADIKNTKENSIPDEWVNTSLGEVCDYISRGVTPKYIESGSCHVLNQRCIRDHRIDYNQARLNNEEKRKIPDEKIIKKYDVLVCSTGVGTLGRVAQIKDVKNKTTVDSHVTIVRGNKKIDSIFLDFLMRSKEREIEYLAEGSTGQTELSKQKLAKIEFNLPTLLEQKAIADTLSSFDEKIELLREQNKTLEETAQIIFKEWFGKYSVDKPDELPGGWRVSTLGETVKIKQGKYIKSEKISETMKDEYSYTVYGGGGIRGYLSNYDYEKPQVCLTCRGNGCGLIQYTKPFSTVTNSCMALEDMDSELNSLYLYLLTKKVDFGAFTSGSAQPQITVTNLQGMEVIIPEETILEKFNFLTHPMFEKIRSNLLQIQSLEETRDTLLPKLMKGEVKVKF